MYADKEDNIYYLSNGRFPNRNPKYDWSKVVDGTTSETLWDDEIIPLDSLPQVLNPLSGWVFNTNNTPFSSSDSIHNPKETDLNKIMGYQSVGLENNRSTRFLELMQEYDTISYDDFKRIKYDNQYPSKMILPNATNLEMIMNLDETKYPEIADAIQILKKWNRKI